MKIKEHKIITFNSHTYIVNKLRDNLYSSAKRIGFSLLIISTFLIVGAAILSLSITAKAQEHSTSESENNSISYEEFLSLQGDNTTTATDMSSFLDPPAGKHGRVAVCGDHLCFEDGTRARFWGVNINRRATIPEYKDAEQAATRLARLGFNAVRLGDIDGHENLGNLLNDDPYSLIMMDRFDYFFYQLKQKGIYSLIIINSGASYLVKAAKDSSALYHKDSAGDPAIPWGKYTSIYDQEMIRLQKEWIVKFLSHKNPYTKLTYANDPALFMLEIGNENSLFRAHSEGSLSQLSPFYAKQLDELWGQWKEENLDKFRSLPSRLSSNSILPDWNLFGAAGKNSLRKIDPFTVRITPPQGRKLDEIQYSAEKVQINAGWYLISFSGKADTPRPISVIVQSADRKRIITWSNIRLKGSWSSFEIPFYINSDGLYRMSMLLGDNSAPVEIRRLTVRPRSDTDVMLDKAYVSFLMEVEGKFFDQMRKFIRRLGYQGLIVGTNAYGLPGLQTQAETSDVITQHMYWDHPRFIGAPWHEPWVINNKSMLDPSEYLWPLIKLAWSKVDGKPFVVTEFGVPNANRYSFEYIPLLANFAISQGWDGVFLFKYTDDFTAQLEEVEGQLFNIERNAEAIALLPLTAQHFLTSQFTNNMPFTTDVTPEEIVNSYVAYKTDLGLITQNIIGTNSRKALESPVALRIVSQDSSLATNPNISSQINKRKTHVEPLKAKRFVGCQVSLGPSPQLNIDQANQHISISVESSSSDNRTIVALIACPRSPKQGFDRWVLAAVSSEERFPDFLSPVRVPIIRFVSNSDVIVAALDNDDAFLNVLNGTKTRNGFEFRLNTDILASRHEILIPIRKQISIQL